MKKEKSSNYKDKSNSNLEKKSEENVDLNKRKKYSIFSRLNSFSREHPIFISVFLIVSAIILFRLSFTTIFLNHSELFLWSLLLSDVLFLAGLLVLVGWWKNHIATNTTNHNINWKNY